MRLAFAICLWTLPALGVRADDFSIEEAMRQARETVSQSHPRTTASWEGWRIERDNRKEKAVAVAGADSTLRTLGEAVGLEAEGRIAYRWSEWAERRGRLEFASGESIGEDFAYERVAECESAPQPGPVSPAFCEMLTDAPLLPGQKIETPNVIVAIWAGKLDALGKKLVGWNADLAYLRARGFLVVELERDDAKFDFKSEVESAIREYSKRKVLYGLFVTGHGGPYRQIALYGDVSARVFLKYRLAFGLFNSCGNADLCSFARKCPPHDGLMVPIVATIHPAEALKPGELASRVEDQPAP